MKKKIDTRIQTLIDNGIKSHQRTMLVLIGDRSRYQIVNFHYMLTKSLSRNKPKVLWCYKNDLEFSSHQKKRIKEVKNMKMKGLYDENTENPFDLFIASTEIRYTYYKDSHKILGNTYQLLILQDFEALTPNLLCRTIQTIEGGGIIIFLLKTMTSLKQLHTLAMDVHQRYRTEAFKDIEPRFNQRFLLSLAKNKACVVMDDELNVLPISDHLTSIESIPGHIVNSKAQEELNNLKKFLADKEIIGKLLLKAKTLDQAKVIMTLVDILTEKQAKTTVSITAGRGRGKSAAIGIGIAAAIKMGMSSIYITAPSPENLNTLFQFVCIGLASLDYQERLDYDKVYSSKKEFEKVVLRIDINKTHHQFIQYVFPNDAGKIGWSDLIVIDEAAAIPLPYIKSFFGPHHLFMCSTVNGYEGTGRSLSLKLIEEIRHKNINSGHSAKRLRELTMTDPIRYALNDPVELWLNELLLLNATEPTPLKQGQRLPHPSECELYIVNRDTLFSYKYTSQKFLFSLMSLFVSSHYKNSPNDLQLLSDSPSHLLFVLLGPLKRNEQGKAQMPDVLCAIQLALEGNLSTLNINQNTQRGIKPSGDLIPWNIRQQFQDNQFPTLAGGRIVRIATHAQAMKMGYGSRALQLLSLFFQSKLISFQSENNIVDYNFRGEGAKKPLLNKLDQVKPPELHYLGTSFGFTDILVKFWRKNGYQPVYLRQTVNQITSEHSGIMLKALAHQKKQINLEHYVRDFNRRFMNLCGYEFKRINVTLALQIIKQTKKKTEGEEKICQAFRKEQFRLFISQFDYIRLRSYSKNQVDYHVIVDLLPTLSKLYFEGLLGTISMGYINQAILVGLGLQFKNIEDICNEIKLEVKNALPLLQKTIIKFAKRCQEIFEKETIEHLPIPKEAPQRISYNERAKSKVFAKEAVNQIMDLEQTKGKLNYDLDQEQMNCMHMSKQEILRKEKKFEETKKHGSEQGRKKIKRQ